MCERNIRLLKLSGAMRRARRVVAATPPFVDGTPGPTPNPNVISGATDAVRPTIPASGGGDASSPQRR